MAGTYECQNCGLLYSEAACRGLGGFCMGEACLEPLILLATSKESSSGKGTHPTGQATEAGHVDDKVVKPSKERKYEN